MDHGEQSISWVPSKQGSLKTMSIVSDYQQGTTWMCIPIGIHSTILNVLLENTEVSGYGLPVVGMQQACYLWVFKKKNLTLCSQSYESHGPYINDLPNQPKSPHSLQIFACVVMKVRQSVPGQLLVSSYWDPKALEKKCRFYS